MNVLAMKTLAQAFFRMIKFPTLFFIIFMLVGFVVGTQLDRFIQRQFVDILINIILAISLNLVNGYTGQFSLGHAGFMAVGAYSSAYLSKNFPHLPGSLEVFSYFFYALAGGFIAGIAGLFVGLPSLRLKGDYLAIVTLGFGEIIRVLLLNTPAVGGATGYTKIPGPENFFLNFLHALFWVVFIFTIIWRLIRSGHGRNFLSVREDEVAAEAMGVNTTQVKVRAFVLSSAFAGIAGSLFAHFQNMLAPSTFSFNRSVDVVIMVVLGGMGSLSGSVIAAIFITVTPELLRPLQEITGVDVRMVIYSLCLILLMILRPKGLFHRASA